jgi:hypothetical protein
MIEKGQDHIRSSGSRTSRVLVDVVTHVSEVVVEVREEVGCCSIASLPYRISRSGVLEAYCPVSRCTLEDGMGKTWAAA